jgi:putative restriction endonuclease
MQHKERADTTKRHANELDDDAVFSMLLRDLSLMKVHHSRAGGDAKKKPLLLLLVLSRLEHGGLNLNEIRFEDLEQELSHLIERFGGREGKSGSKPEQPFFHLQTSPFWQLELSDGKYSQTRRTPPIRVLRDRRTVARLDPSIFDLLAHSRATRERLVQVLLERWPPAEAIQIRHALSLS